MYGACATIGPKPSAVSNARSAAASAGSMALAREPRGLRVKNWNVVAPMRRAVSPIARKPPEEDR